MAQDDQLQDQFTALLDQIYTECETYANNEMPRVQGIPIARWELVEKDDGHRIIMIHIAKDGAEDGAEDFNGTIIPENDQYIILDHEGESEPDVTYNFRQHTMTLKKGIRFDVTLVHIAETLDALEAEKVYNLYSFKSIINPEPTYRDHQPVSVIPIPVAHQAPAPKAPKAPLPAGLSELSSRLQHVTDLLRDKVLQLQSNSSFAKWSFYGYGYIDDDYVNDPLPENRPMRLLEIKLPPKFGTGSIGVIPHDNKKTFYARGTLKPNVKVTTDGPGLSGPGVGELLISAGSGNTLTANLEVPKMFYSLDMVDGLLVKLNSLLQRLTSHRRL